MSRKQAPHHPDLPPAADVAGIGEALRRIAPRVEARPWNRRGADKSWVLRSMWSALLLRGEIQRAKRVRG
jgi:hypothetical protein